MKILKLVPECKNYIWGGTKLKDKYGKNSSNDKIAETWELSFHKDGKTKIKTGEALESVLTKEDLGKNCSDFSFFPVLAKFIDAQSNLSVQVHPSDEYALREENSFGKTEMWYIVEAEKGAGIYLGFNRKVTSTEYEDAIKNNTLTDLLNFYEVETGKCYFIPSGTIHAIGAGCLICEIQQNSNLTYRVYDYGRVDASGNPRELHINKAIQVTNLDEFSIRNVDLLRNRERVLALNKYFTVTEICTSSVKKVNIDPGTFKAFICIEGNGKIGTESVRKGETVFVGASNDIIEFEGEMKLIMTEIRKYYVGIDLGGTFIKGGIVDDIGNIIVSDKVPTECEKGGAAVIDNIAKLVEALLEKTTLSKEDLCGIGIGVPGMIDSEKGNVIYSNNLNWKDFRIADELTKKIGIKVKIANDANVAVLGEVNFGAAKNKKNVIMLTLGTGVGGGIICNGQLIEGNLSVGAELGHMVIAKGGELCSCGRKGCLEAYASATALIRDTKKAMSSHKDTEMWKIGSIDKVDGKTAFDFASSDKYAKEIVDNYIESLAEGIVNFGNIFRPELVLLGGGVCAQGDELIKPLQKLVNEKIYAGELGPEVKIAVAKLENSAGILGAASLLM